MNGGFLERILANLHDEIHQRLQRARDGLEHPVAKGDASENVWLEILNKYLPKRYKAAKAYVVDSWGARSDQIDVVVYDRQYSPLIFEYEGQTIIPAESVYAIFEVKPEINAKHVKYACQKVASVRRLHRTSLPIPHAGGTYPQKPLISILGGLLTLDNGWKHPLGKHLLKALCKEKGADRLDLGCVAACGYFKLDKDGTYAIHTDGKPATAFLFELISQLQSRGTVQMIDIRAYSRWLSD